jgi:aspartate dehydrogenase
MRVALIGCGAIGKVIIKAILAHKIAGVQLAAAAEIFPSEEVQSMATMAGFALVKEPERVLEFSPDLVIEAAEQEVARKYAPLFLKAKKDLMILSIGALADTHFLGELLDLAKSQGVRIIVPSGAIGGLDAIKSANVGDLTQVVIRNIKPPAALEGAPFILRNKIDLKSITCRTQIYDGFADEAAREFPKNLNVAVALSLAGIGPEKTRVIVIVDPKETCNIHEITAKGDFGEAIFTVAGLPSPDNPKTSYLAGLSAIATLQNLVNTFLVGT